MNLRVQTIILLLIFLLFITGCKNPFSHRSSDDPVGTSGTWDFPAAPEIVISNLLFSYNERNINNFRRCLSDSFMFSAYEDSIEAEQNGEGFLFHGWDVDTEESVTRRIFQAFPAGSDSVQMTLLIDLSSNPIDEIDDSTATLVRTYTLTAVDFTSDVADTLGAEGEATFKMSWSNLEGWSIYLWSDRAAKDVDFNWADFKALFR
ncbi:MAG: hypothetical protein GF315_03580 [candidate division Zixibacteria bacterium]|nr:hypothetical protein [candidate division Zixibacteria bacterium]